MEKDYSLLRPFDLDAAKHGEPICTNKGEEITFVAEAGPDEQHCIRLGNWHNSSGSLATWEGFYIRMAPLCWVEGKPVYKGDVLYHSHDGKFVVTGIFSSGFTDLGPSFSWAFDDTGLLASACTWTPPNVKREGWVNIYPRYTDELVATLSHAHATKEAADVASCGGARIACVRIEWEE